MRHPYARAWRPKFLEGLATGGVVLAACSAAGISRATAYRLKAADPTFATEWSEATDCAADRLELEARRRAVVGTERPVFQGGAQVGVIREYSDVLLIFLLKGYRPERFRDGLAELFERFSKLEARIEQAKRVSETA